MQVTAWAGAIWKCTRLKHTLHALAYLSQEAKWVAMPKRHPQALKDRRLDKIKQVALAVPVRKAPATVCSGCTLFCNESDLSSNWMTTHGHAGK